MIQTHKYIYTINEMIQIHKYKYIKFYDSNTQIHIQLMKNERNKMNTATQAYIVLARGHLRYIFY